ncbi:FtsB family cell division protein [Lolliginicoccus suaedae]|uniref:FtsB family cell division protein n=1 Tax=Lolliginicoccus suaedae TaxID=2605429 RepID=UPI0011EFB49F|nr:septum formation initiator family protein [Lolliginicoccus suaedae]
MVRERGTTSSAAARPGREARRSADPRPGRSALPRRSGALHGPDSRARGTQAAAQRAAARSSSKRTTITSNKAPRTGWSTRQTFILALVVGALVLTFVMPLRTYFSQWSEARQIAAEQEHLRADVAALRAEKELQDDPAYIKEQARERLRYVFPGETPYRVQFFDERDQGRSGEQLLPGSRDPWYTQLWREMSVQRDEGPQREMNMPIAPIEQDPAE